MEMGTGPRCCLSPMSLRHTRPDLRDHCQGPSRMCWFWQCSDVHICSGEASYHLQGCSYGSRITVYVQGYAEPGVQVHAFVSARDVELPHLCVLAWVFTARHGAASIHLCGVMQQEGLVVPGSVTIVFHL